MIYKTLKKVSDVCQVLDKSKYNPSQTKNGVTFTNNGDESIIVNGTATANVDYRGISNNAKLNVVAGHKYLMRGCPAGGSKDTYDLRLPFLGFDYGNGLIAKLTDNGAAYYYMQIIVRAGIVCDNLIFKPQLFDLTEMYGAGNEPTTVEQFRQDFPEELYDYKPYCFVKSYKSIMICKTKNLFPTSTVVGTLSGWSQSTARQFEEDKWYIGITANNYYEPSTIIEYELTGNYVYINTRGNSYGIGKAFKCEPNQTYTMTCKWVENTNYMKISIGFYDENGNYLSYDATSDERRTFTTPANCKWFTVCFVGGTEGSSYVYNIQLEKGSNSTDFVPNGYIQSYKKSLICTTKNLFDINSVSNINNWVTSVTAAHPYGYYTFYLKPNTTYTFSRKYASNNDSVYACFSKNYGVGVENGMFIHPTSSSLTKKQLSFITGDTGIIYLNVYGIRSVMNSFIELIEGAQLELGDTATEYHPYGYL